MDNVISQPQWLSQWPEQLSLMNCPSCDWTYLLPPAAMSARCLHCGAAQLDALDAETDKPVYAQPPELLVPFSVAEEKVESMLANFVKRTWLAPLDLKLNHLTSRLQKLYVPVWLVDTAVSAQWEAETGFNYDVVSHREHYQNGQWRTERHNITKIRWEARVGTLKKSYDNVQAPALEEHAQFEQRLGKMGRGGERPFHPHALINASICLPNRPPEDAWPEAREKIKQTAAEECRIAAAADHQRLYRWSASFAQHHWTQLLYPVYATHYVDDTGTPRQIFIHGQTGKLSGQRRASMKKAQKLSVALGITAVVVLAVGLLLLLLGTYWIPNMIPSSHALMNSAVWIGLIAMVPLAVAGYLNHFYYAADT